jgi:hypothetical protein
MKTKLFLRIAAVVTLLYCGGHTSGIPWTPGETKEANEVVSVMKETQFMAADVKCSYWNFYYGFGATISAFLLAAAVTLWQLGSIAAVHPSMARPMMITFFVCFIINAWFSWRYFFALPAVFALAISLLTLIAFLFSYWEQDEQHAV